MCELKQNKKIFSFHIYVKKRQGVTFTYSYPLHFTLTLYTAKHWQLLEICNNNNNNNNNTSPKWKTYTDDDDVAEGHKDPKVGKILVHNHTLDPMQNWTLRPLHLDLLKRSTKTLNAEVVGFTPCPEGLNTAATKVLLSLLHEYWQNNHVKTANGNICTSYI